MAACRPGIGDPLGYGITNPYADGRPNWQLQAKKRIFGPNDTLATGLSVKLPSESPYAHQVPEMYRIAPTVKADIQVIGGAGRRHYEHHLQRTEGSERRDRGLAVPEHLVSGYDRPYGLGGKAPVDIQPKIDPKDGGVWEPVRRQYPKYPKIEREGGCRIVEKPIPNNPDIHLRPVTITIRDQFKPGGVQIFQGKRDTNPYVFPNARGYTPPKNYDDTGARIDYSSIQHGGTFGVRMLHNNEPYPLSERAQSSWKQDSTLRTRAKIAESLLTTLDRPFGDSSREQAAGSSRLKSGATHLQQDLATAPPATKPMELPPASGAAAAAASVMPSRGGSGVGESVGVRMYVRPGRVQYEDGLQATTAWTCFGAYRP